jgi:hypothetical protein
MIKEREELMGTIAELEQDNATMRAAIESRGTCCDGGKCHAPPALDLPDGYADYTLTPVWALRLENVSGGNASTS